MSSDERWSNIDQLVGWKVCLDFDGAVKAAHLRRRATAYQYMPASDIKPLSESEEQTYDQLNEGLHERMRQASHSFFKDTTVPKRLQQSRGKETYFTPFTHQNYDWYGPSYECYIVVLTDYISAKLLSSFQSLLRNEYRDWCIVVVGSDSDDFGHDHEIAVFSDQILVPANDLEALAVPQEYR